MFELALLHLKSDCLGPTGVLGLGGYTPSVRAALSSLLDSPVFSFSFKKKLKSRFHGVGLWVLPCRQGDGRPDGGLRRRPGGVSLQKGALCRVGLGGWGQGIGLLAPPCLFSGKQMEPYASCGEGCVCRRES